MHFVTANKKGQIVLGNGSTLTCPIKNKPCGKDCPWFNTKYESGEYEYDKILCKGDHIANLRWRDQNRKIYKRLLR